MVFMASSSKKKKTEVKVEKKEEKVNPALICERCGSVMKIVSGAGRCGTDLKCPKCNLGTTKVI